MSLYAPRRFDKVNPGKPLRVARPAIAGLGALLLMSSTVPAQTPAVEPRMLAARSTVEPNEPVWETAIAAGEERVMAVYRVGVSVADDLAAGYAMHDRANGTWTEGLIPMGEFTSVGDPVVAYDPLTSDFLACAIGSTSTANQKYIVVARFAASAGAWSAWQDLTYVPTGTVDKPWIVRGASTAQGTEFYMAHWHNEVPNVIWGYDYHRSTDGGQTWVSGQILIDGDTNDPLVGYSAPFPRVHDDGPLYLAYPRFPALDYGIRKFKFVVGEDIVGGEHDGEVEFQAMYRGATPPPGPEGGPDGPIQPLPLSIESLAPDVQQFLPGAWPSDYGPGIGADFSVDPNNPDRLYFVMHDVVGTNGDDAKDVDIFLYTLTRFSGNRWNVSERQRVNQDDTPFRADQFMPNMTVDENGVIHIVYYDDRRYNVTSDQVDGPNTSNPKFDVVYAWSDDAGDTWHEELLEADPNSPDYLEPVFDFGLDMNSDYVLRDYIGIDWFPDPENPGHIEVWTSFMGTSVQDTNPDQTVLWSSRIAW